MNLMLLMNVGVIVLEQIEKRDTTDVTNVESYVMSNSSKDTHILKDEIL
jgi:hypothetical protein